MNYEQKILIINGIERKFEHDIRTVEQHNTNYYVLLSIPYNVSTINNLFCINNKNGLIWQAEDLDIIFPQQKNPPYERISISDDVLFTTDFWGRCYQINLLNGQILKQRFTK